MIQGWWLGRAMVLGSFQCRGVLLLWHMVGPAVLAAGAGWVCYFHVPHRRGGGNIVFGADPVVVGVSVSVGVSVTLSCLHDISRTGGWILTKFAWM